LLGLMAGQGAAAQTVFVHDGPSPDAHAITPPALAESWELADATRFDGGRVFERDAPGARPFHDMFVAFASGSARLTPAQTRKLDAIGRSGLGAARWIVEGFADTVGTRESRADLARRRAEAVSAYLQTLGVTPDQLEVRGSTQLIHPTPDQVAAPANRQVKLSAR
jgi:outer membrane protein OmpA-like peptidoglycan-associated protein